MDFNLKNKMIKSIYNYYRIKEEHIPYHGDRYFQLNINSFDSTTVVLSCGEIKKGKGNQVGIYTISKQTVFGNYIAMNRCVNISKKAYQKAFETAIKIVINP